MKDTLSDQEIIELLRTATPVARTTPAANLWPRVEQRLAQRPAGLRVTDWILVLALAILCLVHPSLAGVLLLHF